MKDDGFADENVGFTCLPSAPKQSERFKFDVNIIPIILSFMSRVMISEQIRTNRAVHCIAAITW